MDYYGPPDVHRKAVLLEELEGQKDELSMQLDSMHEIERDWTSDEEDKFHDLEKRIQELERYITNVWGDAE